MYKQFPPDLILPDRPSPIVLTTDTPDELVTMTIPKGIKASKRYTAGHAKPDGYPNAMFWNYGTRPYDGFDELVENLRDLESIGDTVVIRGELIEGTETADPIVRRLDYSSRDDFAPTFTEHSPGRRSLMIDLDDFPNPFGRPVDEPAMRALTYWLFTEVLPPEFHHVAYYFQWSNSMGWNDPDWKMAKIHFWVLLEQPVSDTVLRQWAEPLEFDHCLFNPIQVHYVARPQFVRCTDPVGPWRSGVVKDYATADRARLAYEYVAPEVYRTRMAAEIDGQQSAWKAQCGAAFRKISASGGSRPMQMIAAIGVGGRLHAPIIASAASWVYCLGSYPDREAWKECVRRQIMVSGSPHSHARSEGSYLNRVWDTALRKFQPADPKAPSVPPELFINTNKF